MSASPNPPPRARRRLLRAALPAAALAVFLWITGCVSTITPPASPADPIQVFLVESGRHAGLALPDAKGGFIEYSYGEWEWYARCRDRWYHAFSTVLWPTEGTLGRRKFAGPGPAGLTREYGADGVRPFAAERKRVIHLRDSLEQRFQHRLDEMIYNPLYELNFVPVDEGYWFLHTCHDESADWLRALGCEVSWVPIRGGLRLAEAP